MTGRGSYSKDFLWKVYEKHGDLFLLDLADFTVRQITNTLERESSPGFSGNEKWVVFRRGVNLFGWNVEDGSTLQLTDFKEGNDEIKNESGFGTFVGTVRVSG